MPIGVDHEVHAHGVRGVLRAGEAGLDHREAGLHEHDEEAADQRPHEVDGDLVVADGVHDLGERRVRGVLDGDVLGGAGRGAGRIADGRGRGGLLRSKHSVRECRCQGECEKGSKSNLLITALLLIADPLLGEKFVMPATEQNRNRTYARRGVMIPGIP